MTDENGGLISKIDRFLDKGDITVEAAVRLLLESQTKNLKSQEMSKVTMTEQRDDIKEIKKYIEENPSVIWLLKHKTAKTLSFFASVIAAIVLVAYVAVTSEAFREFLLGLLT